MTCWLALTAVTGYLLDAAGLGIRSWAAAASGIVFTAAIVYFIPRESRVAAADLIAWTGVVVFVSATLLLMAMPSLLPPGRGPDLTHHLLLVDYIETNRHLVHDRSLGGAMGEMAHYTPAAHLLAVMAGQLTRSDGLHAFFPLVVLCAALTAGFVFLIARRLVTLPFAIVAVAMLFLPAQYFFGAFTHDGFLAQTVSTLFAVAMWWAVSVWADHPSAAMACVVGACLSATFLSWPIWIGPPLLVFVALSRHPSLLTHQRWRHIGVVIVPLLLLFLIHSMNRWGWMVIVRASGAVLQPSLESVGWLLPVLAGIGVFCALSDRRARMTLVLLLVIALQALTLFVVAKAQDADTPYMALKMMYFAIYPLTVLAALAVARLASVTAHADTIGWVAAAVFMVIAVRPALATPRNVPVVSTDLYQAGKWLRANGGAACADYLVGDAETAYWLHLAVLGNPRSSPRTSDLDHFNLRAALAPWITSEGRDYAIADLRLLPEEVKSRVDVRRQFGSAAVVARPGPRHCTQ